MQRPIIYWFYILLALGSVQLRHVTSLSHSDVTSGSDGSDGGRSRVLPHRYSNWEDATDNSVSDENKGSVVSSKKQQQHHSIVADNDDTDGYLYQQQQQQQQLGSSPRDVVSEDNNWQLEKILAINDYGPVEKRTNADRSSTQFSLGRSWMGAHGAGNSRYLTAGGAGAGGNGASRRDTRRQFKFGKKSTTASVRPYYRLQQQQQRLQTADIESDSENDNAVAPSDNLELEKPKPTTSHKRKMIKFGKKSISPSTFNAADGGQDVDDVY